MFQKTDSKELERTITLVLCIIFLAMPVVYLLQLFGVINHERVEYGEVVLAIGSLILLMFDIMFWFQKENRYFTVFGILILLYLISVCISIFTAENIGLAISGDYITHEGGAAIVSSLIIMFSTSLIRDEKNRRTLYDATLLVGMIQFITGVMQANFHSGVMITEKTEEHVLNSRAFGTIVNPNPYGSVMVLLAALEYGLLFGSKSKKGKITHAVLSIVYTYCVVLSGTRGSWVGLAVTSLVCSIIAIIIEKKQGRIKETIKKLLVVMACVVVAVLASLATAHSTISDVSARTQADSSQGKIGEDRLVIWKNALKKYTDGNIVIGVGVSNLFIPISGGYILEDGYESVSFDYATDAHSRYINILCTQGMLGLVTYLVLIVYILVTAVKRLKNGLEGKKEQFALFVACIGFLVADAFCIRQLYMTPFFFAALGMLLPRKESKHLLGKDN